MSPAALLRSIQASALVLPLLLVARADTPQASSTVSPWPVRQQSNSGTDIFVVAHADDWQVFLGDVVVERIRSGRRPVFIYLTAGDDGRDSTYWRQREIAALRSTRVVVRGTSAASARCGVVQLESRPIRRCTLGSSESFFLRLPDGNRNGGGFARNRFESLRKLRTHQVVSIHAVDSSTRYTSWQDLTATMTSLVRMVAESTNSQDIVLHTTDPSVRINPHDHYDHRIVGKLTEKLLKANGWSGRYYIGYALSTRAPNRTAVQHQEKLEVFSAYDRAMMELNPKWSAYGEHPRFYADCMHRTYSRSFKRASLSGRIH